MNRRERLEQILWKNSRGDYAMTGSDAFAILNAYVAQEKVIESAREIADTGTWRLGSDERDNIMRHAFNSVDAARAALAVYDSFMEGSET